MIKKNSFNEEAVKIHLTYVSGVRKGRGLGGVNFGDRLRARGKGGGERPQGSHCFRYPAFAKITQL